MQRLPQNKFNVLDYSTVCFDLSRIDKHIMVQVIEGKIIKKMTWRERKGKLLQVSEGPS